MNEQIQLANKPIKIKSMGATKPKHHHSDRDRIYTPEALVLELIKKILAQEDDTWCDPCAGRGVFYDNFPTTHKTYFEIDEGTDFLETTFDWDWCVTNIPFSQPKEFIFKMAECSRKGFGILCLSNSMTVTRLERLKKEYGFYPLSITEIYVKSWGFGYKTCFYVFTKKPTENIQSIIID